jgi:LmbE family N-acetylglucosaminyl deacetylase
MNDLSTTVREVAKRTVRTTSSTAVRGLGIDVTEPFSARSCLIVAPHPDDETLGCGSTMARMRSLGTDVRVVFVTGGGASPKPPGMSGVEFVALRRAEASRALRALGVDESAAVHLDFEDGELTPRLDQVADALVDLVQATTPQQMLVTSVNDRHPDHVAVGRAARAAVNRCNRPPRLYEYPIWQRIPAMNAVRDAARAVAAGGNRFPRPIARPRLVRTDEFRNAKQQAITAYESQLPHFPVGFVEDFLLPYESFTEIVVTG